MAGSIQQAALILRQALLWQQLDASAKEFVCLRPELWRVMRVAAVRSLPGIVLALAELYLHILSTEQSPSLKFILANLIAILKARNCRPPSSADIALRSE